MTVLVGLLSAPIVVSAVYWVLTKLVPTPTVSNESSLEALASAYSHWAKRLGLVLISTMLALIWPFTSLLCRAGHAFVPECEGGFVLYPGEKTWMLPAALASLFTAGLATQLLSRRLLGGRFPQYVRYCDLKQGYDTQRASRVAGTALAALTLLSFWAFADSYVKVAPNALVENPLMGLHERRLPFANITEIRTAPYFVGPIGQRVGRREYVVVFRSGERWTTQWAPVELEALERREIY